jgi:hypothetical protein
MFRTLRHFSQTHSREIICYFHGNKVMYSIPMHGRHEAEALGRTLNLEIDLKDIKPQYKVYTQTADDEKMKTFLWYPEPEGGCCEKK